MRSEGSSASPTSDARAGRAYEAARAAYGLVLGTFGDEGLDAGEGVAACMLLSRWLAGDADARKALMLRTLSDTLYEDEPSGRF